MAEREWHYTHPGPLSVADVRSLVRRIRKRVKPAPRVVLTFVVLTFASGWGVGVVTMAAPRSESEERLRSIVRVLERHHLGSNDADTLYEMAARGLLRELDDPYSHLYTEDEYRDFAHWSTGRFAGLGVRIDEREGRVTIFSVLPGTPAERAGVLQGDRILQVDGVDASGWDSEQTVRALRGERGTPVHLTLRQGREGEKREVIVIRDRIRVSAVEVAYMVRPDIGYLRLAGFTERAAEDVEAGARRLIGQGARGLILDLRGNPGGLLEESVRVADLFLPRGVTVVEVRGGGDTERLRTVEQQRMEGVELVLLVDGTSASAAEILAGALQDHGRAVVVGKRTMGKGSVQSVVPLRGGRYLKTTTARWFTPAGRSIQRHGPPSTHVENTDGGGWAHEGAVGGIVPDHIVSDRVAPGEELFLMSLLPAWQAALDVFFRFADEVRRKNPERDGATFRLSDREVAELRRVLEKEGVLSKEAVYREEWLRRLAEDEVVAAGWGASAMARYMSRRDEQVRQALRLFER